MNTVALLIGGNQGNRQELIEQATALIRDRIGAVVAVSADYDTEPWGDFGDDVPPPFLNRALLVQTDRLAHQVLEEALHIESLLGRIRPATRNDSISMTEGASADAVGAGEIGEGNREVGYIPSPLRGTPPVTGGESADAVGAGECSPETGELSAGLRGGKNKVYNANRSELKAYRKELRNHGTSAEAYLWTMLKCRQVSGYRFRRQFSIGHYILDFYCPELRLAIELDGASHKGFGNMQLEYDRVRDEYLKNECGVTVLRFENKMVFSNPKSVIGWIEEEIIKKDGKVIPYRWDLWKARNTPSPLRGTPPVPGGESADAVGAGEIGEGNLEVGYIPSPLRGTPPVPGGELADAVGAGEIGEGNLEVGYTPSPLRGTPPVPGGELADAVGGGECFTQTSRVSGGTNRTYHSRTMDIDLIFWNDEVIDMPDLQIPHPRAHLRRFVLEPLAEIMPDYKHPLLGLTVVQLLRRLGD